MSDEQKKDPAWYERWLELIHPKDQDSRADRRHKAAAAKALNERVMTLATGYFESMESFIKTVDRAGLDVNTRQEMIEKHRELVLMGLDKMYREWLRMHPEDYVYDSCASLFVARVVEISRSQTTIGLN